MYTLSNMIRVKTGYDLVAKGYSPDQMIDVMYDLTASNEQERLLFESASLAEIDEWYNIGDIHELILEAITIKRYSQADGKLKALARVLDKHLPENIEVEKDETGGYAVQIGKPKKTGSLFATVTAQIPFSDGQTLSIIFHSPDGDKTKIAASDEIIAFRFLLNKRDITHVVSPEKGKDVSLDEISKRVTRIVAKTSEKFQAKQRAIQEQKAELVQVEADIETATIQLDNEIKAAEKAKVDLASIEPKVETAKTQVEKLEKVVGEKEKRLAELQAQKTASAGKTHGSSAAPETDHPNEPTPAAPLEVTPESAPQTEATPEPEAATNPEMTREEKQAIQKELYSLRQEAKKLGMGTEAEALYKAKDLEGLRSLVAGAQQAAPSETLPIGWAEATPGGLATNKDPLTGGIVDKEIVSGEWFVIPNNDKLDKMTGFQTRESALANFAISLNSLNGNLEFDPTDSQDYSKVLKSEALQLKYQDELDAYFSERIMAVRNELRKFGTWSSTPTGDKLVANEFEYSTKLKQVGGGKNVVGVTHVLSSIYDDFKPIEMVDMLQLPAKGIAQMIEGQRQDAYDARNNFEIDPTTPEGYAKVMADEALQIKYQDELDPFFQARFYAVREALKNLGFKGSKYLQKEGNNFGAKYDPDFKQVGAGKNIVGIDHVALYAPINDLGTPTGQDTQAYSYKDDLTKTPEEIAAEIDAKTLEQPEPAPEMQPEPEPQGTLANKISPEMAIKIAADDIESLRGIDVYRVLNTYSENAIGIAAYIKSNRPDLVKKVDEAMKDLIPESEPQPQAEPETTPEPVIFETEIVPAGDQRKQRDAIEAFDKFLSENIDKSIMEKVSGKPFDIKNIEGFGYYKGMVAIPLKGDKTGFIQSIFDGSNLIQMKLLSVDRSQLDPPSQFFTGKKSGMYGLNTLQGENDKDKYQDFLDKIYNNVEPEAVTLANDVLSGKYDNLPPDEMADLVEPIYDLPEDQYGDLMDQVDAYTTELTKKAVATI